MAIEAPGAGPRIRPLSIGNATENAARALRSPVGHMTIFRMLAHAEGNVLPLMKLGGTILTEQQLDPRSRELAILVALAIEGGRYEWPQHVEIGLSAGVSPWQIDRLTNGDFETDFDPRDRALLAFAAALVARPQIDDHIYADLQAHFSDREIVETIITIGFYMMLARVTEALNVDAETPEGLAVIQSLEKAASSSS